MNGAARQLRLRTWLSGCGSCGAGPFNPTALQLCSFHSEALYVVHEAQPVHQAGTMEPPPPSDVPYDIAYLDSEVPFPEQVDETISATEQDLDEIMDFLNLERLMDPVWPCSSSEYSRGSDTSLCSDTSDTPPCYTDLNDLSGFRSDMEPRSVSFKYNIAAFEDSQLLDSDENNVNVGALYQGEDPDDVPFLRAAETVESPTSPRTLFDPLQQHCCSQEQISQFKKCYPSSRPNHTRSYYDSYTGISPVYPDYSPPNYMSSSYDSLRHDLPPLNIPNLPGLRGEGPRPSCQYSDLCDEDSAEENDSEIVPRRGRRGSKSVLLWKFLLDSLKDPDCCPEMICWENRQTGVFKFVDTAGVARLWGKKKRKEDMNFEKLSRGIRHYYRGGMMNRVEGKRLVYKFNWRKIPLEFRQ